MQAVAEHALYGNHLEVSPSRLWWIDRDHLARVADSPYCQQAAIFASNHDPGDIPDKAEFAALVVSLKARGWQGLDRIAIGIDGRGRIVITDGLHRAATALTFGFPAVPIVVVYRSVRWVALKHRLYELGGNQCALYQPIDHPEFVAWQAWRTDTTMRAERIAQWLRSRAPAARAGLDYACHTGGLTRALAVRGYDMYGVDTDLRAVDIARGLNDAETTADPHVAYAAELPRREYDFCACLSLLNHHATDGRSAEGHCLFRDLVERSPLVFTDCPTPGDPVGGASPLTEPAAWMDWLAASGAPGRAEIVAERGPELQRTLLVWVR